MPFKSESQVRKCYALKNKGQAGSWNCDKWEKHTKSIKALPERVKEAMIESFTKIAKQLFDPKVIPTIPVREIQKQEISKQKENKRKGMSPAEYRKSLTMSRTGVVQKNVSAEKVS